MNQSSTKLVFALESADIAAAAVTSLLLIVPPMGILAGFCPQSICLALALLIEALACAALQILKMHFEAARD